MLLGASHFKAVKWMMMLHVCLLQSILRRLVTMATDSVENNLLLAPVGLFLGNIHSCRFLTTFRKYSL